MKPTDAVPDTDPVSHDETAVDPTEARSATTGRIEKVRRPWVSMVDIAYEALLEAIFNRTFEPGERLEIRSASERLDMSPTPIREALARLTTQGLTVLDANRGYRVAGLLTASEFHNLYQARRVLEIGALRQDGTLNGVDPWMRRVTDEEVEEVLDLERLVGASAHGPHYADYSEFSRADSEFHGAVLALVGNPFLEAAWHGLYCHLHVSRLYAGSGVIDFDEARVEHALIARALIERNVNDLATASLAHIDMAETRLAALLP